MNRIFVKIDKFPSYMQYIIFILIYLFIIGISFSILAILVDLFIYAKMGKHFLINY